MPNDPDHLSPAPFPDTPPGFLIRLFMGMRKALIGLANRFALPEFVLFERSTGMIDTMLVGAAARLGIADHIGDGALTADEIAARTGSSPDALHRTLRCLASKGIFTLRADGRFANNRFSDPLRAGRLTRTLEWARYFSSASNVSAWADFDRVLATGKNAFNRVHGKSVWAWFDEHPDERETFAHAMMGLTVFDAPTVARLYPFGEVKRLCDVGGGRGTLLSELLIRFPHLEGVLCDGAGVLESARDLLERRGVEGRTKLVPGSFFEEVPGGCDAYLMKHVLHDWDDETSVKILKVCRRAIASADARLLLVEILTPRSSTRGYGPLSDVHMMTVCDDGRERSREDFARLLDASGFRLTRVLAGPTVSVLEGRPAEEGGR